MKKTIIINIGNSIVHIEEDAYEVLTAYLNEIKLHFTRNQDDFEIVKDIENRIAEMFAIILAEAKKPVIEMADVQQVIAQMGSVKDIISEDGDVEEDNDQFQQYSTGVKRLFRDTDEGVVAGVCAGLGHYLNVEARWVRLIAFLLIFLGGSGILAYLILWLAVPRAKNRTDKMGMKGEATNLYGFKKNFEEELAIFNEKMQAANSEFKPILKNSGNIITELISVIGKFISGTAKLMVKAVAGFFILFGFMTLIGLIICLAGFIGFWDEDLYTFPFSIINEGYRTEILFGAFVVLFIPVLALVLFAIRVAFNKMTINRTVTFGLLIIWLLGVASTTYYATRITAEFQEHAEMVKVDQLKSFPSYIIDIDKSVVFSKEDSLALKINEHKIDGRVILDDHDNHPFRVPRNVRIKVIKSDDANSTITQTFESQGKSFPVALRNAQNINYKYTQTDSLIMLSPRLQLKQESAWRNQEVTITIKVPVGTRLKLNKDVYDYVQYYYYNCNDEHQLESDYRIWVMTVDGLKCESELKMNENQLDKTNN